MQEKISNLAKAISGYAFRGAIEPDARGDAYVLQAKNIIFGENVTDIQRLTKVRFSAAIGAYFLQKGDVVMVSRGAGVGSFRSVIFESGERNVVASSSVIILRINDGRILPDYLSLYLNSPQGQNQTLETVSGSYIQAISRGKMEELKIPVPSIENQRLLIALAGNIEKQRQINDRQSQIRKNIINAVFQNLQL